MTLAGGGGGPVGTAAVRRCVCGQRGLAEPWGLGARGKDRAAPASGQRGSPPGDVGAPMCRAPWGGGSGQCVGARALGLAASEYVERDGDSAPSLALYDFVDEAEGAGVCGWACFCAVPPPPPTNTMALCPSPPSPEPLCQPPFSTLERRFFRKRL